MKRIIFLLLMLFVGSATASAQASLPDSYFVNKAYDKIKRQQKDMLYEYVYVGTQDGMLTYVVRGDKRTEYPQPKKPEYLNLKFPYSIEFMEIENSKFSKKQADAKRAFAKLQKELSSAGWVLLGPPSEEGNGLVYVFVRGYEKEK